MWCCFKSLTRPCWICETQQQLTWDSDLESVIYCSSLKKTGKNNICVCHHGSGYTIYKIILFKFSRRFRYKQQKAKIDLFVPIRRLNFLFKRGNESGWWCDLIIHLLTAASLIRVTGSLGERPAHTFDRSLVHSRANTPSTSYTQGLLLLIHDTVQCFLHVKHTGLYTIPLYKTLYCYLKSSCSCSLGVQENCFLIKIPRAKGHFQPHLVIWVRWGQALSCLTRWPQSKLDSLFCPGKDMSSDSWGCVKIIHQHKKSACKHS